MNENQKRYNDLITQIQALTAKGDRTAEENQQLSAAINEAKDLKSAIELEVEAKGLADWGKQADWSKVGSAIVADEGKGAEIIDFDESSWLGEKTAKAIKEPSYKRDWLLGLRHSFNPDALDKATLKALQEGRDDYGGYWTPFDIASQIIGRKAHPSEILGNVTRLGCSSDKLYFPKFNYTTDDIRDSALTTQWTGELGTTSEDTSLQVQGMMEIAMHEGTLDVQMSRSWTEDQAFDYEAFIRQKVATAYTLDMDRVIVSSTGNGIGKPHGILKNPGGTDEPPTTNVGNPVGGDGLFDLKGALPAQYRGNAKWLANTSTVWADLAQIKAGSNEYIGLVQSWNNNPLGNARVDAIIGDPLIYSAYMPAAGAANNILVYGDFREGYGFVERVGLSAFPYGDQDRAMLSAGLVGVMFRFRVGGRVLNPRALRVGVQS